MSQKEIINNGLKYLLNEDDKTATIFGYDNPAPEVLVPRSIIYNSNEYLVISISDEAFKRSPIRTLKFDPKTELQFIGKHIFAYSPIECVFLPSNIKEIKSGFCKETYRFKKIEIIRNGAENIKFIDDKILVGKSDVTSDIFDVVLFARRDIEEVVISPEIKRIGAHSFEHCRKIKSITIPDNSELQYIDEFSFYDSSIDHMSIPSSIIEIKEGWCCGLINLNELKILPRKEVNVQWIDNSILIGKSDVKSDIFDLLIFARRNIEEVTIPAQIRRISSYSFDCCGLKKVEFQENSQLQSIGIHGFASSAIESIKIPSQVTIIEDGAFCWCQQLLHVEFSMNSKIQTIEEGAFHGSVLESLSIPSNILNLKDGWCSELYNLKIVNVMQNGDENIRYVDDKILIGKSDVKSDVFDVVLFGRRDIEEVVISPQIKKIAANSFEHCSILKRITIPENSELQILGSFAFSGSAIENLFIPQKMVKMDENALSYCDKLKLIEVANEEIFHKYKNNVFNECVNAHVLFPSYKKLKK